VTKKRKKDGFHRKQLKLMLARMGVNFNENATNWQLRALLRDAYEENEIKYEEKSGRGTDIYDRGRRLHGSFNG